MLGLANMNGTLCEPALSLVIAEGGATMGMSSSGKSW